MSRYDWLAELKIGDEVIENNRIIKVTAIHKRHIICGLSKYRKTDGKDITSSGYYSRWITKIDDKAKAIIIENYKRNRLLRNINRAIFSDLDTDSLSKIVTILESSKDAQ